jgi:hypothetical protein
MDKCTQLLPFVQDLFDDRVAAQKATQIVNGILKAHSPRLSEIARAMRGSPPLRGIPQRLPQTQALFRSVHLHQASTGDFPAHPGAFSLRLLSNGLPCPNLCPELSCS